MFSSKKKAQLKSKTYQDETKTRDHLDLLSSKLVDDLRNRLSQVCVTEVFSDQWKEMTSLLERIAIVVVAESSFEAESKDATLWEREEAALRNILESGKMNVFLRMLEEYKVVQRDMIVNGKDGIDNNGLSSVARSYEASICTIFKSALDHPEVVQTIEIRLLLKIIRDSLQTESRLDSQVELGPLETSCFSLVTLLLVQSDELAEDLLHPVLLEFSIFPLFVRHLARHYDDFEEADQLYGLRALSLMVDSEEYGIHEQSYFPQAEDKSQFMQLEERAFDFSNKSTTNRRQLRALIDEMKRLKRSKSK
mmetsp:Transcript_18518/g.30194  ORF Transcript_18518/g.30194 Transcript_18518/m.30194 type:complete len:308 (-) Transcript_18518:149-1072(-)|eukprot:CAMPEP_0203761922 /NCGR_PEP_ID=MMETSP0098-20131031/14911_1 /ASSEMBLY_ACC=CAM_ASM_000208 /TAXON_ID=96639 /ORGANISM=" , Strain NY0313808BC1" /LENGTH=307 /DNA_ID=CAMNT_0050656115 /DNA_START=243 /DNA_END=1166 /DNA_ORIENTATION=+